MPWLPGSSGGRAGGGAPPAPPANLQVLPKDIPRPQLLQAMQNMVTKLSSVVAEERYIQDSNVALATVAIIERQWALALLDQVLRAFPAAPVIVMICDNDSIHHARKVTAYLEEHPRLELLYGARYSPHDNPADAESTQAR